MSYFESVNSKKIGWVSIDFLENRIDSTFYSSEYLELDRIINKSNFSIKPLNKVSLIITQGPNPQFSSGETEYKCLKTKNLYDYEIYLNECDYISKDDFNVLKKYRLEYGDILIGIKGEGSIGKNNIYTYKEQSIFTREIGLIRLNTKLVNNFYVSAFLRSRYGKQLLQRGISGSSGQKTLSVDYIKNMGVIVPERKLQDFVGNKIAEADYIKKNSVLYRTKAINLLNDALMLNDLLGCINDVYNHNWVDSVQLNDRIDSFYYNPKVVIINKFYKKYRMVALKDLVSFKKGFAFRSSDMIENSNGEVTKIFKVSDLTENAIDYENLVSFSKEISDKNEDFEIENEDIIMAVTGTIGKSTLIFNKLDKLLLNQNAIRFRRKKNASMYYVDLVLKTVYFQEQIKQSIHQSVQPFISMEFLNEVKLPLLDESIIDEISTAYKQSLCELYKYKQLIQQAKQDVEDLIEGTFDMSKLKQ